MTGGQVFLLVGLVPVVAVLGLCLTVVAGIVQEGLERHRKLRAGEIERYTEDELYDAGPPAALATDGGHETRGVACPFCGTNNDAAYAVCRDCGQWV